MVHRPESFAGGAQPGGRRLRGQSRRQAAGVRGVGVAGRTGRTGISAIWPPGRIGRMSCGTPSTTRRFSAPDDRGLYYSAFPAPKPGEELSAADLQNAIYFHALGHGGCDRRMFGEPLMRTGSSSPPVRAMGAGSSSSWARGEVGDKGVEDLYLMDLAASAPAPRAGGARLSRGLCIRGRRWRAVFTS